MTSDPTRRRVLQLSGAGATASIAGCTSIFSESEEELSADAEPDIDPSEGITAIVQPSEEALMEAQQEVMADVEDGEIDQQEAQLEMQERQQELFMSRSIEFEGAMVDTSLSIEAAIGEHGAFLLTGSDDGLIDLLRNNDVEALLPGEEYEEALQAYNEGGAEPEPEPEPEPDEEIDGEDSDSDDDADEDEESDADDNGESDADDGSDSDDTDEEPDDADDEESD
ncbi:hypothetical protein [Natronorubrum tibetense]|uniref:Uncharacterized protein n=1 Tax=Natronorubrum tibetense GA33 TaxID=1114856 RepID=L9W882_9EURY|nr:hypothetical protein [Natronorubrum tibetense]ELY45527.1 hypothetical protein C496_03863 [Natronorubrum tibetense GA33]